MQRDGRRSLPANRGNARPSAGVEFAGLPVEGQVQEGLRHPLAYESARWIGACLDICEPLGLGCAPGADLSQIGRAHV